MKKYSVCYPIRPIADTHLVEILLGRHKDTPGARKLRMVDKWNGFGGKFEEGVDRDMFDCAIRECHQESGLIPVREHLYDAGIITFNNSGFWAEVHFFFAAKCQGELITETDEMQDMTWYLLSKLPYADMMDADKKFQIPHLLYQGMLFNQITTNTIFHDEEMKVVSDTGFKYQLNPRLEQLRRPQ